MGNRVTDDNIKLSYLIQFCSGDAKKFIEDWILIDPTEGYQHAHHSLGQRYGQAHIIARSHIDCLTNGTFIKAMDVQGLKNRSQEMQKCELTLSKLGYMSDVNSAETICGTVSRLPTHIRTKWVEKSNSIIERY